MRVCEIADAPDEAGDHDRRDDEDDKRCRVLRIFHLQGKQRLDEKVVQPTAATDSTIDEIRLSSRDSSTMTIK